MTAKIRSTYGVCEFSRVKSGDITIHVKGEYAGYIFKSRSGFGLDMTASKIYFSPDGSIRRNGGTVAIGLGRQKDCIRMAAIIAHAYL